MYRRLWNLQCSTPTHFLNFELVAPRIRRFAAASCVHQQLAVVSLDFYMVPRFQQMRSDYQARGDQVYEPWGLANSRVAELSDIAVVRSKARSMNVLSCFEDPARYPDVCCEGRCCVKQNALACLASISETRCLDV